MSRICDILLKSYKMMQILYGDMQAVRSGGDLTLVGGTDQEQRENGV